MLLRGAGLAADGDEDGDEDDRGQEAFLLALGEWSLKQCLASSGCRLP